MQTIEKELSGGIKPLKHRFQASLTRGLGKKCKNGKNRRNLGSITQKEESSEK